MKGIEREWPSDDEIVAGIKEHGNESALARAFGIPRPSLQHHINNRVGLRDRVQEARRSTRERLRADKPRPQPGDDVTRDEQLEQENRELRKALDRARSEDVREQRVIDAITTQLAVKSPRYKPAKAERKRSKVDHEFVLLLSDLHAGEVVSAEETAGVNEYDWDVMLARLERLRDGILSYREHRSASVACLHILGLGDMLSGNIHEELRETNSVPLAEATVQLGLDLADWVETFIPEFPAVRFSGVVGNHPRETKKRAAKRKFSNADWTCYQIMRQRLAKCDVACDIPKAQRHMIEVCERHILMSHGDAVGPSAMVGVPTGGIVRHVARLSNQYASMGRPFDHFVCGHFHEANMYKGRRIFINGSVVGPSEYGLEAFGEAEPPAQLLIPFNRKHGAEGPSFVDLT